MATQVYDVSYLGTVDESGQISQLYGKKAIENSIVGWLTSFRNDFIRNPGRGGYITQYLFQPMTPSNRINIMESIEDGFKNDYTPYAELLSMSVIPNYEQKTWEITLEVYIAYIKDTVEASTVLRNFI